ncbi:Ankyrin repeat protein [Rickettsiales bacterium Ac37b]|nr:Ankyrin repeat protein [Rickettsiales bacterium Ac37b]
MVRKNSIASLEQFSNINFNLFEALQRCNNKKQKKDIVLYLMNDSKRISEVNPKNSLNILHHIALNSHPIIENLLIEIENLFTLEDLSLYQSQSNSEYNTPLMLALSKFHYSTAISLISSQLRLLKKFENQRPPLSFDIKMTVNAQNHLGETPLHRAVHAFNIVHSLNADKNVATLLDILLCYGANPNIFDNNGNTSVHSVALVTIFDQETQKSIVNSSPTNNKNAIAVLKKLKMHGADLMARNNDNKTVFNLLPDATAFANYTRKQYESSWTAIETEKMIKYDDTVNNYKPNFPKAYTTHLTKHNNFTLKTNINKRNGDSRCIMM